jgi:hypothetical protein
MYTCQEQHGTILQQNLKTLNVDMPRTTRDNPPAKLQTGRIVYCFSLL